MLQTSLAPLRAAFHHAAVTQTPCRCGLRHRIASPLRHRRRGARRLFRRKSLDLAPSAAVSGVIAKEAADRLMDGLEAASKAGTLFWANNFYTYIARKKS